MNRIYMDNAATTPTSPEVLEIMLPYFSEIYGNPSSIHDTGRCAKRIMDSSRKLVAAAINAKPSEIYFTSGGSESDNWALKGVAYANSSKGNHIITSAIEHPAVLHTCRWLEKHGFTVTYLPVDEFGILSPETVENAITDQTILVSIMAVNNEIGTIEPIAEIGKAVKKHNVLFHTDAVQAIGSIPVDVEEWTTDLLSLSAHKFHGPKGIGVLYIRTGVRVDSFINGGLQERTRRAGTENLPGIIGLAKAITRATEKQVENSAKISMLRDKLISGILNKIPQVRLNGHPKKRLPGNANFSFRYIEGEALLLRLDMAGIAGSSGSACASGSLDPSHVLLAIGLSREFAQGSLRLTLSENNTEKEVDEVLQILPDMVAKLRAMSPLFNQSNAYPS